MKTLAIALSVLAWTASEARANFGYCFTKGLMGGTKVLVHDNVREAEFWKGDTVEAYRKILEGSHRFRFESLSCPSFDTELEARDSLTKLRLASLENGFAEFLYPQMGAAD
jgi:hypothetical protein